MAISGNDFARLKGRVNVGANGLIVPVLSVEFLEVEEELEALLVGETVQRTS